MRISDRSSDVCSSDLVQGTADYVGFPSATYANSQAAFSKFLANNGCTETDVNHVSLPVPKGELITGIDVAYTSACSRGKDNRSEERRVGKEGVSTCRYRWAP